jgi:hypothetical protein
VFDEELAPKSKANMVTYLDDSKEEINNCIKKYKH